MSSVPQQGEVSQITITLGTEKVVFSVPKGQEESLKKAGALVNKMIKARRAEGIQIQQVLQLIAVELAGDSQQWKAAYEQIKSEQQKSQQKMETLKKAITQLEAAVSKQTLF